MSTICFRTYDEALAIVRRTYDAVKAHHEAAGHAYVRSHWQRYVGLVMRLPPISPGSACLEIGASIFSNILSLEFGGKVTTVYHELEPEWRDRFASSGIAAYSCELMRDRIPVPDNSFDLVLFDQVMEHFPLAPDAVMQQLVAKLTETGTLILSAPNFASSEKRLALLRGTNPQDPMDPRFVYYAHHREPVMQECVDLVDRSGGLVGNAEWLDYNDASTRGSRLRELVRQIRHGRFHPLVHFLIPSMRSQLFLSVTRRTGVHPASDTVSLPLSATREFIGTGGSALD